MYRIYLLIFVSLIVFISGCTTADITRYTNNSPKLDIFEYFRGETTGWGVVRDWKGDLTRQFTVEIIGEKPSTDTIVLTEDFTWSDGELSQRIWTITKTGADEFTGVADDVIGTAVGRSAGNVLNWQYQLNLDVNGNTYKIHFDDWMYLQQDDILINIAEMRKFGIQVGEVTIVFAKKGERR